MPKFSFGKASRNEKDHTNKNVGPANYNTNYGTLGKQLGAPTKGKRKTINNRYFLFLKKICN